MRAIIGVLLVTIKHDKASSALKYLIFLVLSIRVDIENKNRNTKQWCIAGISGSLPCNH